MGLMKTKWVSFFRTTQYVSWQIYRVRPEATSLPPEQIMDLPPLVVWTGAMPLGDGPHGGLLRLLRPLSAAGHRLLLTLIPEALESKQSVMKPYLNNMDRQQQKNNGKYSSRAFTFKPAQMVIKAELYPTLLTLMKR